MYKKQSQPSRVLQQGVSSHLELAPRHCCLGQNMRIKIHFYDIHLLPTVSIQKLLLNFLRKWEGKWNRFSLPVEPSLPARCFYVHRSTRIFAASFNRKSYNSWLELLFNWKQYFRYWRLTRIDFRCRHKAKPTSCISWKVCWSTGNPHARRGHGNQTCICHFKARGVTSTPCFQQRYKQCPEPLLKTRHQAQNRVAYPKSHVTKPRPFQLSQRRHLQ